MTLILFSINFLSNYIFKNVVENKEKNIKTYNWTILFLFDQNGNFRIHGAKRDESTMEARALQYISRMAHYFIVNECIPL
jgi:hypothetical protein